MKALTTEQQSKIQNQKEKIDAMAREHKIKTEQIVEFETRNGKSLDEIDNLKYKF